MIISSCLVLAANDTIDKGYSCLEGKVKTKCSTFTVEEQAFSLLALAYNNDIQSECANSLKTSALNNECWPKSACKLKETSLVTLALQRINSDSSKPEIWLLKQNKTADDLTWYLEIDSTQATTCKINYDGADHVTSMAADKKLSGSPGSCLSLANSNYWLQISNNCINKNFKVSCDKDFVTALLYKKSNSDIWQVSSQTKSASANGMTENQVNSLCFKQNNVCDYEGSLWATLAISKNYNTDAFLPYLIALAPDNDKYDPNAFLYKILGSDEYLANVKSIQFPAGFWDLSSSYTKYYDTALSLFALQDLSDDSANKARTWLLSEQGTNGCWQDSVKLTAFILYAGWPKPPVTLEAEHVNCGDYGKFCLSRVECSDANGDILTNYFCSEAGKVCCSNQIAQKTCSEKGGIACNAGEQCSGSEVTSSDSSKCCVGTCEKPAAQPECEKQAFTCKTSCSSAEEIKSLSCPGSEVCCALKQVSKSYWWLYLLIILIILVVLGIIFRNKLSIWIFQLRNKFKKGPVTQTRPPFMPPSSGARMARPMFPQQFRQQPRPGVKPKSKLDQELDETLKKLRDMSK